MAWLQDCHVTWPFHLLQVPSIDKVQRWPVTYPRLCFMGASHVFCPCACVAARCIIPGPVLAWQAQLVSVQERHQPHPAPHNSALQLSYAQPWYYARYTHTCNIITQTVVTLLTTWCVLQVPWPEVF